MTPTPVADPEKPKDPLKSLRIQRREEPPRRSRGFPFVRTILILLVLGGVGFAAYVVTQKPEMFRTGEWIPDAIRTKTEVRVAKVMVETGRSADALVVATGYLESFRQANIGAKAAGRVESIGVEEGTLVKGGEVIAVLDHKDLDAALVGAKAALDRAQAELGEQDVEIARSKKERDRIFRVRESGGTTEAEYDRVDFQHRLAVAKRETMQAAVTQAQARVQENEQMKENMVVRAPFDGTVISKNAEVGESILPGGMGEASGRGSVVTIADLARLEVECDVKEGYIGRVTQGSPAEVAVDAVPDRRYTGRVRKVIPMGDRARATIKVKVEITNADERLFPEMSATVYFLPEPGEKPVEAHTRRVFCDSTALVTVGKDEFVWSFDAEGRVKRIDVVTGAAKDGRTEIIDGLSGGERVILSPSSELQAGQQVKLRE
ncbi:efflux RND transporter periplasmic adaptor subunit [Planctomyces sp. SH-PL14]|uniref:efflux RND transporter periplasmic adaptor subunit n=1 Tax=Planctomyces sp. SH-PL14 TaxID=1632864 RepID=UPI00078C872D|nr:efflux RND transporter periplasmic adaptor subunit [Planctomyces sp. SH-PL14]AMV18950.1 Macrolide export protein MacA [Planctomyces sp. SH-PL14]